MKTGKSTAPPGFVHSSIVLLCLAFSVVAKAQFSYTTTNGTITITGYTGSSGAVMIPDIIDGLPVTSIGCAAFRDCTNVTSVAIPNSIIAIDGASFSGAFGGCANLASVTIGNSVAKIGEEAFAGCTSLKSVTLPTSVAQIAPTAFLWCSDLSEFNVEASNMSYASVDGVLFNKDLSHLIAFPAAKVDGYTIPDSVTIIGNWAFMGCNNLTKIAIPNDVATIGAWAFSGCLHLTNGSVLKE